MRWPSVYCWGWLMLPGLPVVFVASLYLANFTVGLIVDLFNARIAFIIPFMAWLVAIGLLTSLLTRCPRCGRSAYQRSATYSNTMWPVRTCTKCGLDLRAHPPFDASAKQGR